MNSPAGPTTVLNLYHNTRSLLTMPVDVGNRFSISLSFVPPQEIECIFQQRTSDGRDSFLRIRNLVINPFSLNSDGLTIKMSSTPPTTGCSPKVSPTKPKEK